MEKIDGKALVLKRIPYEESRSIVTLFTQAYGLISGIAYRKNPLDPLTIVECVGKRRHGELYRLSDIKVADPLLRLRKTFATMEAAFSICQDLNRYLAKEDKAPELFQLVHAFLQALPEAHGQSVLACFRVKLLAFQGLLNPAETPLKRLGEIRRSAELKALRLDSKICQDVEITLTQYWGV